MVLVLQLILYAVCVLRFLAGTLMICCIGVRRIVPVEHVLINWWGLITKIRWQTQPSLSSLPPLLFPIMARRLILSFVSCHALMKHNHRGDYLAPSQATALITISVIHSVMITYRLDCWAVYLRQDSLSDLPVMVLNTSTRDFKESRLVF